ncbi:MAG TPA: hypothetical protein VIV60_06690, partial [Polyangiaceae bacterium]
MQPQLSDVTPPSLFAAVGNDAVLVAVVPPDPWAGFGKLVMAADAPPEVRREWPWLTFNHPWSVLQLLLRLPGENAKSSGTVPEGWDPKRPMIVALAGGAPSSDIERINAITFDGVSPPIHVRVIVPTENPAVLGAALEKVLAHDLSVTPGRYVLESDANFRLAAAVALAKDYVRVELLYFLRTREDTQDMYAQLERTITAPKPRTQPDSAGVIERLAANGHDIVFGLRPAALARELELQSPMKVMAALSSVDPKMKGRILAEGLGEILEGHLLATSGNSEISEAALALNFENGIHAVSVAQLT